MSDTGQVQDAYTCKPITIQTRSKIMKTKLWSILLLVVLALAFVTPVLAQDEVPPVVAVETPAVPSPTLTLISTILGVIVVLFAVALGGERSTEFVKIVLRWLAEKAKWLNWVAPSGIFSMLLAVIPAYFAAYNFDINLLTQFALFQNVDPELTKVLTLVIIWATSNMLHPKVKAAIPAPAVKK